MRPSVIMYVRSLSITLLNNPLSFMCSSQTLVALTASVLCIEHNDNIILQQDQGMGVLFVNLISFPLCTRRVFIVTVPLPSHSTPQSSVFRYGFVVIPIALPITLSSIGSWFWWCNRSAVYHRLLIRFVHSCTEPILHQLESRTKLLSVLLPCRAKIVGALQTSSFYLLDLSCFP